MIVRDYEDGYLFIPQTAHARGCGELLHQWGNAQFAVPDVMREIIAGTSLHDTGWIDLDLSPRLNDDGTPNSFMQPTMDERAGVWRRGVTIARLYNPYAALMVSMHASFLYGRWLQRGIDTPEILATVQQLHDEQIDTQERLIAHMEQSGRYAGAIAQRDTHYRILRFADSLSLACCTAPLRPGTLENVPLIATDERVDVRYTPVDETALALSPYPFVEAGAQLYAEGRYIPQKTFGSMAEYHQMLQEAPTCTLTFTFVPQ